MAKNIVLLSDGTGNSAKKLFKTNVWRLYQALDLSEPDPANPGRRKQIAYYDDGVGTASFLPLAILGGAFGWGTKRNVLDLYTFLCRHYEEGDSIYGFGFSRGAFTIRMLTGFINNRGLVRAETEGELRHLAAEAFRVYRQQRYRAIIPRLFRPLRNLLLGIWYFFTGRKRYRAEDKGPVPPIKFLGLWDTVAAYGLPIDELTRAWNFIFPLSFPDRKLSDNVECAYHAMAIDDERLSFHPEVWNERPGDYKKVPLRNRLTQVWFAGMHSNLGGGYPDDALAGVPLNWILDKTEAVGLRFLQDERIRLREMACVNGKQYDSRQGVGGLYRYMPRNITDLMHHDIGPNHFPKLHESVLTRIKNRVDGYAPIGLPEKYEVVTVNGSVSQPTNQIRPESPAQAEDRMNHQKRIWNLVWWKRVVYFATVSVFVLLAIFPLYAKATPQYDGPLFVVSGLIGIVGAFLPGFLTPLLKSYQSHPGLFILIVSVFGLALYIASRLQDRIFDKMRFVFDNPIIEGAAIAPPPKDAIYQLHSNPLIRKSSKLFKEKLIPWALLVLIAMFILHGIFSIIDASGFICTPTHNIGQEKDDDDPKHCDVSVPSPLPVCEEIDTFHTTDVCWASRFEVTEGNRYRITLRLKKPWRDSTICATTGGVKKADLVLSMVLFIPFRRHLLEPYFKPIARIGQYGSDDYPLNSAAGSNDNILISEITARRSGKLFLFVNDAVLPGPRSWQYFYTNNHGTACVSVEQWKEDGGWVQL